MPCACGCGVEVRVGKQFAHGHHMRTARDLTCGRCGVQFSGTARHCDSCRLPLCGCGCGDRVRTPLKTFLHGHHRKLTQRKCKVCGIGYKSSSNLSPKWDGCAKCWSSRPVCACGCGLRVSTPMAMYISGHAQGDMKNLRVAQGHAEQSRKILGHTVSVSTRAKMSFNHGKMSWKQTKPEALLMKELDPSVWSYTGTTKQLPGTPISADFLCAQHKIIVQVDGCYWHECPLHGSGKFMQKRVTDAALTRFAESKGWTVLRFWEHEIKDDVATVVARIHNAL